MFLAYKTPQRNSRKFGSIFVEEKRQLFSKRMAQSSDPDRWEAKVASVFRRRTPERAPQNVRVLKNLLRQLEELGGQVFYYADELPKGTPKQVRLDREKVERSAMEQVLNRLCRTCDDRGGNVMFLMDAVGEEERARRAPNMYGHIFGRSREHPEMQRALEPPMHVDSQLSAGIQFADWIAAVVGRAIGYQLLGDDDFRWAGETVWPHRHLVTHESKLHLLKGRSVEDIHSQDLFAWKRPLQEACTLGSRKGWPSKWKKRSSAPRTWAQARSSGF